MRRSTLLQTLLVSLLLSTTASRAETPEHTAAARGESPLAVWQVVSMPDGGRLVVMANEVTRAQWRALFETAPSAEHRCTEADCPVSFVSGYAMMAFANRLSDVEALPRCYALERCARTPSVPGFNCAPVRTLPGCLGYRLPTYAEWQVLADAAQVDAAAPPRLPCGEDVACLTRTAWYAANAGRRAHPVAQRAANAWLLYDTVGNVAEASWDDERFPALTPTGAGAVVGRLGCSYHMPTRLCASVTPGTRPIGVPSPHLGFRLVRTLD